MRASDRIRIGLKATTQLDSRQLFYLLIYRVALYTGLLRLITPEGGARRSPDLAILIPNWFFTLPPKDALSSLSPDYVSQTRGVADEVVRGCVRLFGGHPQPLQLEPAENIAHWTTHEKSIACTDIDIKLIWEPARFDWAIWLAKAFYFTQEEKYALCFWENWCRFSRSNPVNIGPNWQSGQEIALRLLACVISLHFFKGSRTFTQDRTKQLLLSIARHAERLPATVAYAKAQNNNHLISEAVGLYCAGIFLSAHPGAARWRRLGKKWFTQAILSQIDSSGEYIQHSANYQRMMLTISIWMQIMISAAEDQLPAHVIDKLAKSAIWLKNLLDQSSGRAPNFGHNDGSFPLPFTICGYDDYRPVVQAAFRTFLPGTAFEPGVWDDFSLWLGLGSPYSSLRETPELSTPSIHRIGERDSWASLRAAQYCSRPAHADQLHVDIWHRGINLARDAGTFLYNAPLPWQNSLAGTRVHNTITIGNHDQMLHTGRFLWLDWAQAALIEIRPSSVKASHDGYRKMGIIHQRKLEKAGDGIWLITDELSPHRTATVSCESICLHWLIGDFPYQKVDGSLLFSAPCGDFSLEIWTEPQEQNNQLGIIRAGESLNGFTKDPILGWYSPTYGVKEPALSILYSINHVKIPLFIFSKFNLNP